VTAEQTFFLSFLLCSSSPLGTFYLFGQDGQTNDEIVDQNEKNKKRTKADGTKRLTNFSFSSSLVSFFFPLWIEDSNTPLFSSN